MCIEHKEMCLHITMLLYVAYGIKCISIHSKYLVSALRLVSFLVPLFCVFHNAFLQENSSISGLLSELNNKETLTKFVN